MGQGSDEGVKVYKQYRRRGDEPWFENRSRYRECDPNRLQKEY